MNAEQIQISLFLEIRKKMLPHMSMADSIADLLKISNDSAYRRIRGEKAVTLEELQILSAHFKISIDRLFNLDNKAFLFQGHLTDENYDSEQWLVNLNKLVQHIKMEQNPHIYYLAKDVPFVYPLQFPVLAAFKDFSRRKSLLSPSKTRGSKFSVSAINTSLNVTAAQIIKSYNSIPSTEIWSSECLNSIIKQIQFYHYTDQLSSTDDLRSLYDSIEIMITHLEHQAEAGVKYTFGEKPGRDATGYHLYNNELFIAEDTILADLGISKITFLNHSFINYLTTVDESFCTYTLKAIKNIISRSTPVSWAGEKERRIFFNGLKKKLSDARVAR